MAAGDTRMAGEDTRIVMVVIFTAVVRVGAGTLTAVVVFMAEALTEAGASFTGAPTTGAPIVAARI
jgi:hypothetical protein